MESVDGVVMMLWIKLVHYNQFCCFFSHCSVGSCCSAESGDAIPSCVQMASVSMEDKFITDTKYFRCFIHLYSVYDFPQIAK